MNRAEVRAELGRFLRARRAALTPEAIGLPPGGARRTPGLRRQEVASRAGVGVAWYSWLEQGRDINPSDDVLHAVARALRLDACETEHVFTLARPRPAHEEAVESGAVMDRERRLLDALDPVVALIHDDCWNLLAWNDTCARVTGYDGIPADDRNLLWLALTWPGARRRIVDWERHARHSVAVFRHESARAIGAPRHVELVARLSRESKDFARWWSAGEVASGNGWEMTWRLPGAGHVVVERTVARLAGGPGGRYLVAYTPKTGSYAGVEGVVKASA